MAERGELFHSDLRHVCRGLRPTYVCGETVGVGSTPHGLVRAFMHSPEHRRILLDPRYDRVGIGAVRDDDGALWVTLVFIGDP